MHKSFYRLTLILKKCNNIKKKKYKKKKQKQKEMFGDLEKTQSGA